MCSATASRLSCSRPFSRSSSTRSTSAHPSRSSPSVGPSGVRPPSHLSLLSSIPPVTYSPASEVKTDRTLKPSLLASLQSLGQLPQGSPTARKSPDPRRLPSVPFLLCAGVDDPHPVIRPLPTPLPSPTLPFFSSASYFLCGLARQGVMLTTRGGVRRLALKRVRNRAVLIKREEMWMTLLHLLLARSAPLSDSRAND